MGFFENAYDFDIYGGRFYDIRGDQVNANRDDSTRIGQRGNETYISPSLSHQDDKTCGQPAEQLTDNRMPIDPQSSICNPQLCYQLRQEWKEGKEWQLFQQQQRSIQSGPVDTQSPESSDSQEQPSQSAIFTQSYTSQNTIVAPDTQNHPVTEEDHSLQEMTSRLQHQKIK